MNKKKPRSGQAKPRRGATKARKVDLPGSRGQVISTRAMEEQASSKSIQYRPITDEDCPF
jgi:hypothetical protein